MRVSEKQRRLCKVRYPKTISPTTPMQLHRTSGVGVVFSMLVSFLFFIVCCCCAPRVSSSLVTSFRRVKARKATMKGDERRDDATRRKETKGKEKRRDDKNTRRQADRRTETTHTRASSLPGRYVQAYCCEVGFLFGCPSRLVVGVCRRRAACHPHRHRRRDATRQ